MNLPATLKKSLAENRKFWRDLPARLDRLPVIPKGIRSGHMPRTTPHENAIAYAKQNKLRLYVGYIIYRNDTEQPWMIEVHSFCVNKEGRVVEPTDGFNWELSYYVGIPVNQSDIPSMRYLRSFERMEYVDKGIKIHNTEPA